MITDRIMMTNDRLMIDYHVAKDGLWWLMMIIMDYHVANEGPMMS